MGLRSQGRYVASYPGSSGDYRAPESDSFASVPGEKTWEGPLEVSGRSPDALPVPWRYARRGEAVFGGLFDRRPDGTPVLHFGGTVSGGASRFYPVYGPRSPAGTFGWYSARARVRWAGAAYELEMNGGGAWLRYDGRDGRWKVAGAKLLFPREAAGYPYRIWSSCRDSFAEWWRGARDAWAEANRAADSADRAAADLGKSIDRMKASAAEAVAVAEAAGDPPPKWAWAIAREDWLVPAEAMLREYWARVADARTGANKAWAEVLRFAPPLASLLGQRAALWLARCR